MVVTSSYKIPTRREQIEFDARRLHTLLLFVEHARNPEERVASGEPCGGISVSFISWSLTRENLH